MPRIDDRSALAIFNNETIRSSGELQLDKSPVPDDRSLTGFTTKSVEDLEMSKKQRSETNHYNKTLNESRRKQLFKITDGERVYFK